MLAQDRYKIILHTLGEDGSVKVSNLVHQFEVSIETVRRDLEYLEKEGLLKRVYGGAVLDTPKSSQVEMSTRQLNFTKEKQEVAETAAQYVSEGQSIAVNASTTGVQFVRALKQKISKLTVLTNSLLIANELSDSDYNLILTGGIYQKTEHSFNGTFSEAMIREFYVDTAFVSVSGVSLTSGLTDYDPDELRIQREMLRIAQQTIILTDSSKFDVRSLLKLADVEDVNMIITDSKIQDITLQKYLNSGIEVVRKKPNTPEQRWPFVPQRW